MPPKKARSEKNLPKISFFTTSEKENPWSEDEKDTGITTGANEPIEVDDDVSHETSENKELLLFAPMLMHLLQYILFLSLSYVNHVYKLAQRG
jgi:hypothetical protein